MNFTEIAANNALDAVVIFTAEEQDIVYSNRTFSNIFGYTDKEAVGSKTDIIEGPKTDAGAISRTKEQLKVGLRFKTELELCRKNGQSVWVEVHYSPVYDPEGEITHWVTLYRQNEERKQFQDSISRISNYLSMVVENAPLNLWSIDNAGMFKLAMGKVLPVPEKETEGLLDRSIFKVYEDYPEFIQDVQQAVLGNQTHSINRIDEVTFESYYSPLKNTHGKSIGLIGVSIDVSEREKAEETRNRLNSILEATTDLVALDDGEKVVYINSAGQELLGLDEGAIKSIAMEELYPKWAYDLIQEEGRPKAREEGVWSGETAFLGSEGEEIPTSQVIIAHKTSDGELKYFSTIARDIRNVKENERRLLDAKEKAEAGTRAKSEFLANMSHEIRTPLNGIMGFSEILTQSTKDPELQEYTKAICDSGKSLLHLINDILDLSKIESGKFELQPQPAYPKEILNEIKTLFNLSCKEKKLALEVEALHVSECIEIDETRLRQVLFNLVGNAIKYTRQGYVKLTSREEKSDTGETTSLIFEVKDSGQGISNEDQSHIFETFVQKHDHTGGVGLGLSISNRLIKMMGGAISVSSEVGKGSTFTVNIPNLKVCEGQENNAQDLEEIPENLDFGGATVLIADDLEMNIDILKIFLSNTNVNIIEARDGTETVKLAEQYRPQLILMDLKMPVMNGFEATRELKSNPETQNIPILVITANALQEEEKKAREAGCDGFVCKPISRGQLIRELKKYLSFDSTDQQPIKSSPEEETYNREEAQELVEELKGTIFQEWARINGTRIYKNIKSFGENIGSISQRYQIRSLNDYSNKLSEYINGYNMPKMKQALESFPDLINQIKALTLQKK